ncbi:MAG: kinase/pyrophosphorylase [Alphaproteobacteria bacterium]|nr:kinase/pyrophosphorylase [Alphaproteobacteria bacterium]
MLQAMKKGEPRRHFYLHLVSDATGVTLQGLARACLAQFENIDPVERFWPLVRSERQLERVIADIHDNPGPVLFTLVDNEQRKRLQRACQELHVPCIPVMDHIIKGLSAYTGLPSKGIPGLQHALDDAYFRRMDAVDFALAFDDGQSYEGIEEADVVLIGVSRTSKTPTCIFLARQGIKAANIPYVPGIAIPDAILRHRHPVFIGLTESPDRLIQLRRNRLKADTNDRHHGESTYLDPEKVEDETLQARRFFTRQGWPVIDVTRRSVEETAAEIMVILQRRREVADQRELL